LAAGAAGYFIFFLQGGAGYNLKIISGSAVNKQLSLSERREFSLSERHSLFNSNSEFSNYKTQTTAPGTPMPKSTHS
jgi:hypothetical protein